MREAIVFSDTRSRRCILLFLARADGEILAKIGNNVFQASRPLLHVLFENQLGVPWALWACQISFVERVRVNKVSSAFRAVFNPLFPRSLQKRRTD